MLCIKCGFDNPGSVLFCKKCGVRLDITVDEIKDFYQKKVEDDKRKAREYYAQKLLSFAVILFLLAVTILIVSMGIPEQPRYAPCISTNAPYLKENFQMQPDIKRLKISVEEIK